MKIIRIVRILIIICILIPFCNAYEAIGDESYSTPGTYDSTTVSDIVLTATALEKGIITQVYMKDTTTANPIVTIRNSTGDIIASKTTVTDIATFTISDYTQIIGQDEVFTITLSGGDKFYKNSQSFSGNFFEFTNQQWTDYTSPLTDSIIFEAYYTEIITNIEQSYPTENISIELTTTDNDITNMSYVLDGGLETSICTNCNNSTLNLSLSEGSYNIKFISTSGIYQINSSYNFSIDLTNPIINNNIPSTIYSYNFNDSYFSCSDTNLDSCNISIDGLNKASNTNFTLTHNGNLSYTITAIDLAGNTATENGIVLVNPTQYFYFQYSNGTSITDFTLDDVSYTNYATRLTYNDGLVFGSNTLVFSKLGFADTDITFSLDNTSSLNITTNISISKITVNIYDRTTGSLINEVVEITLIGTVGFNDTTSNGTLEIFSTLFLDEDSQIIASSPNYVCESVYFSFTNREVSIVDIYMVKSNLTNYGTHTVKAITDTGLLVNAAICQALEWKPSLSAFVSVAQGTTDSTGETLLNVELGTKLYKFQCTKGTSTAYSSNKIISVSGTSTTIQLATTIVTPSNVFEGITYSLTNTSINSTHQRITYTWSDSNGLVDIGCLKIYKVVGTKFIELQSSCVSSSSSNIQLIQNINQTYTIRAISSINVDGVVTDLDYIEYQPVDSIGKALKEYGLDIIIPLLFIIIGFSVGFLLSPQNIYISIISTIVMVWLSVAIVPSVISSVIASFVTLICGLMFWGAYKFK